MDLDEAGFDDFDGTVKASDDEKDDDEEDDEEGKEDKEEEAGKVEEEQKEEAGQEEPEEKKKPELFQVPSDDDFNPSDDEDAFNTDFVTDITTGKVQLAVIPDSPVFDEDEEDDPFNTKIAEVVVKKDKEEKRKEETKLKFTGGCRS